MAARDDADALNRLQLLFQEQVARSSQAEAQEPGAAAASAALREAIRSEVKRLLDERLARLRALQAGMHDMPREELLTAYAELFGTRDPSPAAIMQSMVDWVARAVPDPEMRAKIFATALTRRAGGDAAPPQTSAPEE